MPTYRKLLTSLLIFSLLLGVSAAEELLQSPELHTRAVGFAGQKSETFRAFESALESPSAEKTFYQCLDQGTPAARLYGAIGLYTLDREKGSQALKKLQSDTDQVVLFQGCIKSNHTVKELAGDLLSGQGQLLNLASFQLR